MSKAEHGAVPPLLRIKRWERAAPRHFTMTWSMSDNSLVDADLPDKRTGRYFVDTKSPCALNSYRYLISDADSGVT